jgi:site-specific recombinase XerD
MFDLVLVPTDLTTIESGKDLPSDQNPYLVYLQSLAPASRLTMRSVLEGIAQTYAQVTATEFPWWRLRYQHVQKIRADLATTRAPATANKTLTAIRRVLVECRRLGFLTGEACTQACDVPPVRGSRLPSGRALSFEEIQRLLEETETTPILGTRNRALVYVLAGAGLRRAEVSALLLNHYERDNRSLIVRGKGNKERRIPLHATITVALERWLKIRGLDDGPLFYRGSHGDMLHSPRAGISARGIYMILLRLAKQADIHHVSPHDFRRTFITNLLDVNHDLAVAAHLAGHASTDTTRQYDRRGERAMRAAVDAVSLPGRVTNQPKRP